MFIHWINTTCVNSVLEYERNTTTLDVEKKKLISPFLYLKLLEQITSKFTTNRRNVKPIEDVLIELIIFLNIMIVSMEQGVKASWFPNCKRQSRNVFKV